MNYKTNVAVADERQHAQEDSQVGGELQKSIIEKNEDLIIEKTNKTARGFFLGLIFSIPIWILVISFIIWLIS